MPSVEACEDLMPDLDFLAPEYAAEDDTLLSPAGDMFSIGMLAFTLHNNKPLFTNSGSWSNFCRNVSEVNNLRYRITLNNVQGDNEVAGQAFLALWAKRTRILKKCKYISKDIVYLSFKKC